VVSVTDPYGRNQGFLDRICCIHDKIKKGALHLEGFCGLSSDASFIDIAQHRILGRYTNDKLERIRKEALVSLSFSYLEIFE
jgi:hypothetical protein